MKERMRWKPARTRLLQIALDRIFLALILGLYDGLEDGVAAGRAGRDGEIDILRRGLILGFGIARAHDAERQFLARNGSERL